MAVLLDRDGKNKKFQKNLDYLKKYYGIYLDKKGAQDAVYMLLDWFKNEYSKEKERYEKRIRSLEKTEDNYKEVQRCLNVLSEHKSK